jgi:hypothetical protein
MLPKEFTGDKEAWRRKWRAKRKQNEEQDGRGAAAESGDAESEDIEARDREAGNGNA